MIDRCRSLGERAQRASLSPHGPDRSHACLLTRRSRPAFRRGPSPWCSRTSRARRACSRTLGDRYPEVLADHHRLIREAFARHGASSADRRVTDCTSSSRPRAVRSRRPSTAQLAIAGHAWPDGIAIRDRMGLHTGEPRNASEGYVGLDVHRAARICAAGHGGQILISQTTRDLDRRRAAARRSGSSTSAPTGCARSTRRSGSTRSPARASTGDFPPPRTTEAPRNNLQLEVTSFIGREREIEQATRMLEQSSLLTLTGPGGVGKTRVGLRLARMLLDQFEDGVWIVECGTLTDPDFVLPIGRQHDRPHRAGRSVRSWRRSSTT